MLDDSRKEKEENVVPPMDSETIVKLIGIGLVLLIMIIYIIASGTGSSPSGKKTESISLEKLVKLSNKVDDNYTLHVERTINDKIDTFSYSTDGKLIVLEGTIFDKDGILVYGSKKYYLISKTRELKPYSGDTSFLNDLYYDYSFIKGLIPYCNIETINDYKINCSISNTDYLFKYNEMYSTGINELDGNIHFIIVYNSGNITNISVDYSEINKAIKNTDDKVEYTIKITNVGLNDYSSLFEAFKNVLKK